MAELYGLTGAQIAGLQRIIDERLRELRNLIEGEQPPPFVRLDYLGKPVAAITKGACDPAVDKMRPKKGPAHTSAEDDNVGEPVGIHHSWVNAETTDWVGAYEWYGKMYLVLVECGGSA